MTALPLSSASQAPCQVLFGEHERFLERLVVGSGDRVNHQVSQIGGVGFQHLDQVRQLVNIVSGDYGIDVDWGIVHSAEIVGTLVVDDPGPSCP